MNMDSIVEELMKQVASGDNLASISQSVGGDPSAVQSALGMAMPLILGSMSNNASKSGGTDAVMGMLSQMGGSNPMDNLSGFLGGQQSGTSGLVSSLLGSQLGPIQDAIAKKTGLPPAVVGKVLQIAVPMVLGQLSKMGGGGGMDKSGLTSLLGEQSKMAMQSSPEVANIAQQLLTSQGGSGGIMNTIKNLFK